MLCLCFYDKEYYDFKVWTTQTPWSIRLPDVVFWLFLLAWCNAVLKVWKSLRIINLVLTVFHQKSSKGTPVSIYLFLFQG